MATVNTKLYIEKNHMHHVVLRHWFVFVLLNLDKQLCSVAFRNWLSSSL